MHFSTGKTLFKDYFILFVWSVEMWLLNYWKSYFTKLLLEILLGKQWIQTMNTNNEYKQWIQTMNITNEYKQWIKTMNTNNEYKQWIQTMNTNNEHIIAQAYHIR